MGQIRYRCRKCGNVTPHKPIRCVVCGWWKFWGIRN